jgi:transglutaminase-like putative cysteine protease
VSAPRSDAERAEERRLLRRVHEVAVLGSTNADVRALARRIYAERNTDAERAALALACVQSVPYQHDPPGTDPIMPVVDVLSAAPCDCEDRTAALVCLCWLLGLDARAVYIEQDGAIEDHMSSQVKVARTWRWADATVEGAALGEAPWTAVERIERAARRARKAAA